MNETCSRVRVGKYLFNMGWARSTYGARELHTGFLWRNLRGRDHLEDQSVDGTIISRWISRKYEGGALT
jgi:hypothetical protein